jgi:hypothetical protein
MRALIQEFPNALGPATLDVYLHHLYSTGRATDDVKVFDELPEQLCTREVLTSLVSLKKNHHLILNRLLLAGELRNGIFFPTNVEPPGLYVLINESFIQTLCWSASWRQQCKTSSSVASSRTNGTLISVAICLALFILVKKPPHTNTRE